MKPRGVLVFIPAGDQRVMAVTAQSLYNLGAYFTKAGIPHSITWTSAADIEDIRNLAVTSWYDGHPEYSHLLMIDSDMGFPCDTEYGKPNLIRDMIKFNKPVMGCFYAKRKREGETVGTADPHTIDDVKHGFLKVDGIGCGVMMISRDVITEMLEKIPHITNRITSLLAKGAPELNLTRIIGAFEKIKTDERMITEARINSEFLAALGRSEDLQAATSVWMEAIKNNRMNEGRRLQLSEDMSFCWRWINQCGGEIWANVNHCISHVGPHDYFLRYQTVLEQQRAIEEQQRMLAEQNKVAA